MAKAKDTLAEVTGGCSSWLGIDLIAFGGEIDRALAEADAWSRGESNDIAPPRLPSTSSPCGVLYLHGFASGPSSFKANAIVPELVASRYAVRVPDLNEGGFEHLTVTRALAQAKRLLFDRTLVIGSSFGGYVATLLAHADERVKALVLMAPAFDMAERMKSRYGERAIVAWRNAGYTEVEHYAWGGRHRIGYGLLEDAEKHPAFPKVRVPTYVLQGERDDVVPAALAKRFLEANRAHVELELADDDHGLVASADRALAATKRLIARAGIEPAPAPSTVEQAEARLAAIDQGRGVQ
jgi:pimeloyl-ACP methyl ester carboxylesterase